MITKYVKFICYQFIAFIVLPFNRCLGIGINNIIFCTKEFEEFLIVAGCCFIVVVLHSPAFTITLCTNFVKFCKCTFVHTVQMIELIIYIYYYEYP